MHLNLVLAGLSTTEITRDCHDDARCASRGAKITGTNPIREKWRWLDTVQHPPRVLP